MKCGIDLGTMFSAIASCIEEPGGKHVIDLIGLGSADGQPQLRSAVYFDPSGAVVVGVAALNMLLKEPDRVVQWVKRDMGEDMPRVYDGRIYTPPQISSEVLKVLKKDAESWLGEPIDGVVLCVPAWFGDRQREATRQAAVLAGLPLMDLLAEPSAAALAVAMEHPEAVSDRDVLVYDLGGGTFDVVLIRTRRNSAGRLDVQTLCLDGDRKLGGHDWGLALARHVSGRCEAEFGYNPETSEDRREWYMLLEHIEQQKRYFGRFAQAAEDHPGKDPSPVEIPVRSHSISVTVKEFNEVTESLLDATQQRVENVLREAEEKHGVKRADVVTLMCGGSSKLPNVRHMLTRVVGHPPLKLSRTDPELMVVRGAAYAAFLCESPPVAPGEAAPLTGMAAPGRPGATGDAIASGPSAAPPSPAPVTITDCYHAVGIEEDLGEEGTGRRYGNSIILPKGVTADHRETAEFMITEDGVTELCLQILQGADADVERCERIGMLRIDGLPAGRKVGSEAGSTAALKVTVTMWYDKSGILHCTAIDDQTKRDARISLRR